MTSFFVVVFFTLRLLPSFLPHVLSLSPLRLASFLTFFFFFFMGLSVFMRHRRFAAFLPLLLCSSSLRVTSAAAAIFSVAEFDRGFTSTTGLERLGEIKARAREEELSPAPGTYTGVQEVAGPKRDEATHVSFAF